MTIALILLASAATTPVESTTAPVSQPLTLQQRFDKAMELARDSKCSEAIPEFEAIEATPVFKAGSMARSMLLVQKGRCQIRTGSAEAGEIAISEGLPDLRKAGADFDFDVAEANMALGDGAMERWDFVAAKARFLEAQSVKGAINPALLNVKLAQATAFDGTSEPLAFASEAVRLTEEKPDVTTDEIATVHIIHARILMNQGKSAEAHAELQKVLELKGGLNFKASMADLALRSDLAVAAQLSSDPISARKYLAYTGQGRNDDTKFSSAVSLDPPNCGNETGLRPNDLAIVEFAIGDDGRVLKAHTIYTPGSSAVAGQFAKAVNQWAWPADAVSKIPAYLRYSARVELRCTTSAQDAPGRLSPLRRRFADWAQSVLRLDEAPDVDTSHVEPRVIAQLKSISEEPATPANAARLFAATGLRTIVEPLPPLRREALFQTMRSIQGADPIPANARNWLNVEQTLNRASVSIFEKKMPKTRSSDLVALLNSPAIDQDAIASSTLRLFLSRKNYFDSWDGSQPRNWLDYLKAVANDNRLPAHHPLQQLANLWLANEAARTKDFAGAQRYFAATGLSEEQCALIGIRPLLKDSGVSWDDFPETARRYGFDGWVSIEFDIQSDGKPISIRPIISYPPFIFSEATVNGFKRGRFESSYRPSSSTACSASRQHIHFISLNPRG